jgi:ABC-type multidrug transport system ATPase subunit
LLRCLVGWDAPDTGQVLFDGAPYQDRLPAVRAAVALALGAGDEFPDLTVREHLEFMARAHGAADPDSMIDEVLVELGLYPLQQRFPFTLSQGQRRRLGLASCFVRPRRLLILDEPEQNLDAQGREWLSAKLFAERKTGVGVLMACHDAALVGRVADSEVELTGDIIVETEPE